MCTKNSVGRTILAAFCRSLIAPTIALIMVNVCFAQGDRSDYVSDASHVVGTYQPVVDSRSADAVAQAAMDFLDSLSDEQQASALHDLQSGERREWTNVPAPADAGGIRMGLLDENQVRRACDLFATALSEEGYAKICSIMIADDQLLTNGRARRGFGTEYFSIVIFGEPSTTEPWGLQLDGHHVALNLSFEGDATTLSPSFIGTQPESYQISDQSFRPLADEIDLAYQLLDQLNGEQIDEAVVSRTRGRIVTGPGTDGQVPDPIGVSGATFNDEQRETVLKLISIWINNLPADRAESRLKQIEAEIDQMHFAWNGNQVSDSDISYRIQGPSLIIEYACQDLGGDPLNHLHTMYRDPTNEYGNQLTDARENEPN